MLSVLGVFILHSFNIRPWLLDDAFISFRHAENFAAGHGLVYNVGERVEGYTSFLWVLLLGVGKWAGADTVVLSRVLSILFSAATLGLLAASHHIVRSWSRDTSTLALIFLGTSGLFTPWGVSGMEVSLAAFLLLLCVLLYLRWSEQPEDIRRVAWAGYILALAVMARPESVLLGAVLAIHCALRSRRALLMLLASSMLVYIPYFAWRYTYYGFLLPNTFYAKVDLTPALAMRGLIYARDAIWASLPLWIAMTGLLWPSRRSRGGALWILPACSFLYLAYIVLVGGDCMPAFRFIAPVMPLLALGAAFGLGAFVTNGKAVASVVVLVCGFNLWQLVSNDAITPAIKRDVVALEGKEIGLWLRAHRPPETVIATNTAGSLPYYARMRTIDMLGLNDTHIAHRKVSDFGKGLAGHEKGDGEYVLSLKPDLIQFASSIGSARPLFRTDHELFANPQFNAEYERLTVPIPSLAKSAVFFQRKK
jgi:hypothetical protein